jgi:hypothetical protein
MNDDQSRHIFLFFSPVICFYCYYLFRIGIIISSVASLTAPIIQDSDRRVGVSASSSFFLPIHNRGSREYQASTPQTVSFVCNHVVAVCVGKKNEVKEWGKEGICLPCNNGVYGLYILCRVYLSCFPIASG